MRERVSPERPVFTLAAIIRVRENKVRGNEKMAIRSRRRIALANRIGMWSIVVVVVVLIIAMLNLSSELKAKNAAYQEEIAMLTEQIQAEEQRAEEIEKMPEQMRTKEYIETVAKEKLGLVYPGEMVFKAEQ